jgi:threonine/homoserine/homoserine lactone efflux protein
MPAGFLEFLAAALVMELTPGPNMTWLALLSAREGRVAGLQAVAGITSGLTILAIVAASGMATLVAAYPATYEALRWGGVVFLLYLALEAWNGEKPGAERDDHGRHFLRGLAINLLNPKAAAVFLVMIPSFADMVSEGVIPLVMMNVIYLMIATTVHTLIALFAGAFQRALSDPRREAIVRRIFAVALAGVAIWLGFATVRPGA